MYLLVYQVTIKHTLMQGRGTHKVHELPLAIVNNQHIIEVVISLVTL